MFRNVLENQVQASSSQHVLNPSGLAENRDLLPWARSGGCCGVILHSRKLLLGHLFQPICLQKGPGSSYFPSIPSFLEYFSSPNSPLPIAVPVYISGIFFGWRILLCHGLVIKRLISTSGLTNILQTFT